MTTNAAFVANYVALAGSGEMPPVVLPCVVPPATPHDRDQVQILALLSDIHSESLFAGNAYDNSPYAPESMPALPKIVRSWNPDYILAVGDLSNFGSRSEVYKAVLVNSLTSVQPGTRTTEIDTGALNGSLHIFGTSTVVRPGVWLMVDAADPARAEWIRPTAVPDATHLTATFGKAHTAPFKIQGSPMIWYEDYASQGKLIATYAGHDALADSADYCYPASACRALPAWTKQSYVERWGVAVTDGVRTLGPLVTVINVSDVEGYADGAVASAMRPSLATCPSRWCIVAVHNPVASTCDVSYDKQWLRGEGVDLIVSGHWHIYERNLTQSLSGSRPITQLVVGAYGGDGTMDPASVCGKPCGTGCTNQVSLFQVHTVTRATVSWNRLQIRTYDDTGALRDQVTLVK